MVDKKALRILASSVRNDLSEDEKAYCIEKGVLLCHEPVFHDDLIGQIKEAAAGLSLEKTAAAFLYSVSTGDFRYRTALSSLIWADRLPEHKCVSTEIYGGRYVCRICGGVFDAEDNKSRLDMKKHCRDRLIPCKEFMDTSCAGYVLCDLREYAKLPEVRYSDEDFRIINRMLGLAGEIAPANKAVAVLKLVTKEDSLGLTAADAYSVMGVLAVCGLFDAPGYHGCAEGFVPWAERCFVYETDIYYPLHMWRGKYGINYSEVDKIFDAEAASRITSETVRRGAEQTGFSAKKTPKSKAEQYFTDGEYLIDLDDTKRYYYGLSPIAPEWDRVVRFSATHCIMKRSEIYFEGNTVKKLIYEELGGEKGYRYYLESDMDTATNNRRTVIPKTSRGREKTLTPSLLQTPVYMREHLCVYLGDGGVSAYNSANDQMLPIPAIRTIRTKEDFDRFTEEYIALCPKDYDKILDNFHNKKRVKVRFTAGDIFRVQLTPTLYTYALILAKVRQLEKWSEIPTKHPMRKMMTQPIIFRQYALVTEKSDMTAEELRKIPLLPAEFAQDNEILWETYPIVCSKELEESDIDLGFGVSMRLKMVAWGLAAHTFENSECQIFENKGGELALSFDALTGELFASYGVSLGINVNSNGGEAGIIHHPITKNEQTKKTIAEYFGFSLESACDEFAQRFGGITRKQFIELAKIRFKR